jgi:hypothetical protein
MGWDGMGCRGPFNTQGTGTGRWGQAKCGGGSQTSRNGNRRGRGFRAAGGVGSLDSTLGWADPVRQSARCLSLVARSVSVPVDVQHLLSRSTATSLLFSHG